MTLLIHDTTVVTADDDAQVLFGAAVAIDGDRIVDVGTSDEVAAKHPQAERVDGRGKMVMPGFANCHTHFTLTISRGIEEDYSFPSTLRLPKSVQEYLTPEDRSVLAQLGALESIRSGTTAAFEIGRNLADYAGDLVGSGLRLLLGESAIDLDQAAARDGVFDYDDARGEASLQRIEDLYSAFDGAGDGRIRVSAAAHAPEAVSPSFLPRVREMSERFGTPSTIHLNQSWWEVEAVKNVRGVLPLHGDAGDPTARTFRRNRLIQLCDRRPTWLQPAHRRDRRGRITDRDGQRQHGRGHDRGDAHRPLHGARAHRRRRTSDARAGSALGNGER
jgi:5-methylthioadenosine/S-adenosylhomocysteine deaminase